MGNAQSSNPELKSMLEALELLGENPESLVSQYEQDGFEITLCRLQLKLTGDDDDEKPYFLSTLGSHLMLRYENSGAVVDLEDGVAAFRRAMDLTPEGHSDKPERLQKLGAGLQVRFERFGIIKNLQEAIILSTRAVELTPDDDPDRPLRLSNLGTMLQTRFEELGSIEDLQQAVVTSARAVELVPDNHPDKPIWLTNLGTALQTRFEQLGSLEDLQKAVVMKTRAVELTPDDHPRMPLQLNNLGDTLHARFAHLRDIDDLQRAVATLARAVELTPDNHPSKPFWLSNLGGALSTEFKYLGSIENLQEAIVSETRALELTPDDHLDRPLRLNNLGSTLLTRFEHVGAIEDLQRAVVTLARAVKLTPDNHPSKLNCLINLGAALEKRFEHLRSLDDLQEAVVIQTGAVEPTPDNHADRLTWLSNLEGVLQTGFEHLGGAEDQQKSSTPHTPEAELIPDVHAQPDAAALGSMLSTHSSSTYAQSIDLSKAAALFMEAAAQTSGSPSQKLQGAARCIRLLSRYRLSSSSEVLLQAHERALDLVPQVVWLGHNITRRYHELVKLGAFAGGAAADAIAAGQHARAIEWLESGRTIVWGQVIHLRTPLDDLRKLNPQIASDLDRVSRVLHNTGTLTNTGSSSTSTSTGSKHISSPTVSLLDEAHNHYDLAIQYDKLIAQIRELDGFESFLRPRKLSELLPACKSGPVVVINVHGPRCDALILHQPGDIKHVPLPDFSYQLARQLRRQLQSALQSGRLRAADGHPSDEHERGYIPLPEPIKHKHRESMREVLSTLWICVVKPVIDHLNLPAQGNSTLPHLTWCPTGPLVFLPLHAAGIYTDGGPAETVMDFAVSSYTPTLENLLKSPLQAPSNPNYHLAVLVVSQPSTPNLPPIPMTKIEAKVVKSLFAEHTTNLNQSDGTVDAVLRAMETHGWVHLACHGVQNPKDPMKSAFALYDGALELSTLMSKSLPHAELAFLSACQTATGDEKLPEEAVHLAAGMLSAGYKSVVGTMWSIDDYCAPIVAGRFYEVMREQIAAGGRLQPAYALHEATKLLRERVGVDNFVKWVPFVHFGL
ncbi:CHAT domain-containing protein [Cytidiella melzeri]|nr:CHAT domain-containing protein [Cytidiella melzeri]